MSKKSRGCVTKWERRKKSRKKEVAAKRELR